MKISINTRMQDLEGIRGARDRIDALAPAADGFTSWAWFRGWPGGTPYPWIIRRTT